MNGSNLGGGAAGPGWGPHARIQSAQLSFLRIGLLAPEPPSGGEGGGDTPLVDGGGSSSLIRVDVPDCGGVLGARDGWARREREGGGEGGNDKVSGSPKPVSPRGGGKAGWCAAAAALLSMLLLLLQ